MNIYQVRNYCRKMLSASEYNVYDCLLDHKNKNEKYAYPSQERIADESNLSVRTVIRVIKKLVEKGFIKIEKMKKRLGHYNKYELLVVPEVQQKKTEKEPVMDSNDFEDIDNLLVEEEPKNNNSKLIEGKTNIELSNWGKFIANTKMEKSLILQTITLFKKKDGKSFTFFLNLYTDLLAAKGKLTSQILIDFKLQNCLLPVEY